MSEPSRNFKSTAVIVIAALVFVAVVAIVVAGTSSGPTASSLLLNSSDVPVGWSIDVTTTAAPAALKNPCLSQLSGGAAPSASSGEVIFTQRSGIPSLTEHLSTGGAAVARYVRETRALDACRTLSFIEGKQHVRATISALTLATVGQRSAAYAMKFNVGGLDITSDIVIFRTKSALGGLIYSDTAPTAASAIEAFAREAANKANGDSVVAPDVSIVSAPVRVAHTAMGNVGYKEFGDGPPLVMIMGFGGSMETWDPHFVDELALHHRVVLLDNSGIGRTQALPPPLTVDAMANQTSALITTLGLHKPDVLGWSMGGMIAQALAVKHPRQVARLVLCSTYPGVGTVKPPQAAINDLESSNSATVMSALFPKNQVPAGEAFDIAIGDYPASPPASAPVVAAQSKAIIEWWNGRDTEGKLVAGIHVPTFIADGSEDRLDPIANAHRLATLIAGAKLAVYLDAGHAFLFQDETTFVPVITRFLRER